MCGICGIINFGSMPPDECKIHTMMTAMKHRGPDDEGVYVHDAVGLGFVRLSIIDLSEAGHQPMHDESGRYTIVYNGEIYNYIELRTELEKQGFVFKTRTDTEVLLNSYIFYGEECLDKFNGMFSFVIYDANNHVVFGARDRFGVKPFYYYKDDACFIFASDINSILSVYEKNNEANRQQIFDYLTFNRTDHTDDTFFKGIKKLPHGSKLIINGTQVQIKKWYVLKDHITQENDDPIEYKRLFIDAVRLRLRSDVPVGVCLSGGLDSSSIVSVLAEVLSKSDVNTFSAVYQKGEKGDESSYIDLYNPILDNMHSIHPSAESLYQDLNDFIKLHAEPVPSTAPYAQYQVFKLAKDYVKVTLDGQGADEQLGGYHYFYGLYFKELFMYFRWLTLFKELIHYVAVHHSIYGLKALAFFLLPSNFRTKARLQEKSYLCKDFASAFTGKTDASKVRHLYSSHSLQEAFCDHFEYKLEHLLKWDDKNSMAHSVESRTPFLDYRLVEYTLSLKSSAIIKNGYTKAILRKAMKGILPEEIRIRRDKVGFETPEDEWFRMVTFRKLITEIIQSESFKSRGIIDTGVARSMYRKHCNREINISKEIWKWLHLEMWFRQFIDKN